MMAIVNERNVTNAQQEMLDLEEMAPGKFDPEIQFKVFKHENNEPREVGKYGTITREQAIRLLSAPSIKETPKDESLITKYGNIPRETAERLVREHFEYLQEANKKQKEKD